MKWDTETGFPLSPHHTIQFSLPWNNDGLEQEREWWDAFTIQRVMSRRVERTAWTSLTMSVGTSSLFISFVLTSPSGFIYPGEAGSNKTTTEMTMMCSSGTVSIIHSKQDML